MSRPQFRLSTLLWITLAVACWFGGTHYGKWLGDRERWERGEIRFWHGNRSHDTAGTMPPKK